MLIIAKKMTIIFIVCFALLLSSSLKAEAYVDYSILGISCYNQEQTNWCWAACERSILNYFGFNPLPSQTQIVQTVYDPATNTGATVGQIVSSLGTWSVHGSSSSSSLSFSTIVGEINNGEPMIAGRNSHANLIRGFYQDTSSSISDVYWIDPWPSYTSYNITDYTNYKASWNGGSIKDIWL
jgi:hypothetical protein